MIHWSWLLFTIAICLSTGYFYLKYKLEDITEIISDLVSTIDKHNIAIENMSKERLKWLESILPPIEPRVH